MEEIQLTWELVGNVAVIKIGGTIDINTVSRVSEEFDKVFARKIYRIIVDLNDTSYVSTAGYGAFIAAFHTSSKNGGDIVFLGASQNIREIFNVLGLSLMLKFASSRNEALSYFGVKGK
jgi:anti-anti-sigma factor